MIVYSLFEIPMTDLFTVLTEQEKIHVPEIQIVCMSGFLEYFWIWSHFTLANRLFKFGFEGL